MEATKARNPNIDAFRAFAFVAVVILHVFQPAEQRASLGLTATSLLRWAVPLFFIISGYFYGLREPGTWPALRKLFVRLFIPLLIWVAFYATISGDWQTFTNPVLALSAMLTGGQGGHLWFLPALGMSTAIVLLLRPLGNAAIFTVGIVLYAIGLIFGPYRDVLHMHALPWIYGADFKTRWGPFEGTLFIALGYFVGKKDIQVPISAAIVLIAGGLILQVIEMIAIYGSGGSFGPHDFLVGTISLGIGVFLLCQSIPKSSAINWLGKLGPITLGAYCIHLAFIWALKHYFPIDTGPFVVPMVMVVASSSLLVSWALARIKFLRPLMT